MRTVIYLQCPIVQGGARKPKGLPGEVSVCMSWARCGCAMGPLSLWPYRVGSFSQPISKAGLKPGQGQLMTSLHASKCLWVPSTTLCRNPTGPLDQRNQRVRRANRTHGFPSNHHSTTRKPTASQKFGRTFQGVCRGASGTPRCRSTRTIICEQPNRKNVSLAAISVKPLARSALPQCKTTKR